jgi:hypothetical protein
MPLTLSGYRRESPQYVGYPVGVRNAIITILFAFWTFQSFVRLRLLNLRVSLVSAKTVCSFGGHFTKVVPTAFVKHDALSHNHHPYFLILKNQ